MTDDPKQWAGPSATPNIEEMAERYAIGQLAKIYALGLDMRDYDLMRSAFASNGIGMGKEGPEPMENYLKATYDIAASFAQTQHTISNQYITIDNDEAVMWSYGVVYHKVEKDSGRDEIIAGVQYRDRCKKLADGWVITERQVHPSWVDMVPPK